MSLLLRPRDESILAEMAVTRDLDMSYHSEIVFA